MAQELSRVVHWGIVASQISLPLDGIVCSIAPPKYMVSFLELLDTSLVFSSSMYLYRSTSVMYKEPSFSNAAGIDFQRQEHSI